MSMHLSPSLSATDRFSRVIDALCQVVAARSAGNALPAALILLVWNHLRRIERRVLALVAAIQAGRLRVGHGCGGRRGTARGAVPRSELPRGYAWLCRLVPFKAAALSGQLRVALEDPEMVALITASPQMGRLLRPLCRMVGLDTGFLTPPSAPTPTPTVAATMISDSVTSTADCDETDEPREPDASHIGVAGLAVPASLPALAGIPPDD